MTAQASLIETDIEEYLQRHESKELLRFITCGSVDDGKSTLIGRLLHDSKQIYEDQLEAITRDSKKVGTTGDEVDLALLVDGLQSEREQGITIDVAYRYFSTDKRKFIIADTPGHEQYTRNMATGASTSDLAIILIDARYGVQTQTRRHSFIVRMLGIRHIVVAINKMDLVDFSEQAFDAIKAEYLTFAQGLGLQDIVFTPIAALSGDNVVTLSEKTSWFKGESLLTTLESVSLHDEKSFDSFRFPVQYVNRPNHNFRGFSGTVASGQVAVGDDVTVLPSRKSSRVKSIVTYDGQLTEAFMFQAVTLTLEDEIDISRGDMIVKTDDIPDVGTDLDADIVWMGEEPLRLDKTYCLKRASTVLNATITSIHYKKDVNTLEEGAAEQLELNEIGRCRLHLNAPLALDRYDDNKSTGSFILIDRINNNTVGGGMIVRKAQDVVIAEQGPTAFEVELNALVRKHFPEWQAKAIFQE